MISLDSCNQSTNDFLREAKALEFSVYEKLMMNYEKYKTQLRKHAFHITITPFNLNIKEIAEQLYRMGVAHIHFDLVKSDDPMFLFSQKDIDKLKIEYEELCELIISLLKERKMPSCHPLMRNLGCLHERSYYRLRCGVLKKQICIDPVGNIYPCDMLMWNQYAMGSIYEGIDTAASNKLIKQMQTEDGCNECWARYLCGGKCLNEVIWENKEQQRLRCELKKHIAKLQIYLYDYLIQNNIDIDFNNYKY
ncbi:SPASM domain-containing protein [Cellulosilyticum ruminicola]|uniref:SPASM domain-containing protein n=1 Tax=Cellulosilyticum ruminicola TaxID=425254 RepID=UPI0006CF3F68|nr:SPASM domain-containing protein [Cellulosilyticum ruminicola]